MTLLKVTIAARVAQWIRRQPSKLKIVGSIPTSGTLTGLAQLVEHEAFNLRVAGSIPAIGIFATYVAFYRARYNVFYRFINHKKYSFP